MRDLARQLEVEREEVEREDALNAWRMSSVCRRLAEERDTLEETLREEVTAHVKTIADLQDMGEQRDNLKIALEELEESRDFWRKTALNPNR
jgi:cell wall assembly regulator SMI1